MKTIYTVYLAMDEILKDYFVKGFLYQKILQLLEKFHGINISMRTLQQRLHSLGLKRKKIDYNREEVRAAIVMHQSILALPIPPPGQPLGICTFFFFKLTIPGGRAGKAWQCPAPGQKKSANARGLPGGGGWAMLELTDA